MKLVVYELTSTLYQEITTPNRRVNVRAIRPHIYKHNLPAGTLTINIRDTTGGLVKASDPVSISDIHTNGANSQDFFHGYIRFDIEKDLLPNTTYRIELASSGYTFAESAYIGWCNDFDLRKYDADYSPNDGLVAAADMEIWESKETRRG